MEIPKQKERGEQEKLKRIVEKLEDMEFLSNSDKVLFLLTLEGVKPASFIEMQNHPPFKGYTMGDFAEDARELENLIRESGLVYFREDSEVKEESGVLVYETTFSIAKDQKALDALLKTEQPENRASRGLALGYPASAVETFVKGREMVHIEDLPHEIKFSDYIEFVFFKLSKEHWSEELETAKIWAEAIKRVDPDFYRKMTNIRYLLNKLVRKDPNRLQ